MSETSSFLEGLEPGQPFVLALLALLALALILRTIALRAGRQRYLDLTTGIERWILTLLLLLMVVLSVLQIVLRNFFQSGWIWIDPLLRTLVLWLTFLGAIAATARNRHIAIDVLSHLLSERGRRVLTRILSLIAGGICIALANAAYEYLRLEIEFSSPAFLGFHSWQVQSILLLGFGLLAYRFLVTTFFGPPHDRAEAFSGDQPLEGDAR